MGRLVSVAGRVVEVFGDRMLTIGGAQGGRAFHLPVVATRPPRAAAGRSVDSPIRVGGWVVVAGRVSRFTVSAATGTPEASVMDEEGWRFTSKPAIIASSVAVLTGNGSQNPAVDPGGLLLEAQGTQLVGRWIDVLGLEVEKAASDRGFWARTANGARVWVMLAPSLDRGPTKHLVRIRAGESLDVLGRLLRMPTPAQMRRAGWTVSRQEALVLQRQPYYLRALSIRMHTQDR